MLHAGGAVSMAERQRQIALLESTLRATREKLKLLESDNLFLCVRQANLQIMARLAHEIEDHKTSFGDSASEFKAVREALEREIKRLSFGHGCASNGDANPARSSADDMPSSRFELPEHLQPGRSLLHLEGATQHDVDRARSMTVRGLCTEYIGIALDGLPHLAMVRDPTALPEERAAARAELRECGMRIMRIGPLVAYWNPQVHFECSVRHRRLLHECIGVDDAPQSLWDNAMECIELSREQVLLILDNVALMNSRSQHLLAHRAKLTTQLERMTLLGAGNDIGPIPADSDERPLGGFGPGIRALNECESGLSAGSGSPRPAQSSLTDSAPFPRGAAAALAAAAAAAAAAGRPGMGAAQVCSPAASEGEGGEDWCDGAGDLTTADELVEALAISARCEGAIYLLHGQMLFALMTLEQHGRNHSAIHPYPPNITRCVESVIHSLRFNARERFPWEGRPAASDEACSALADMYHVWRMVAPGTR